MSHSSAGQRLSRRTAQYGRGGRGACDRFPGTADELHHLGRLTAGLTGAGSADLTGREIQHVDPGCPCPPRLSTSTGAAAKLPSTSTSLLRRDLGTPRPDVSYVALPLARHAGGQLRQEPCCFIWRSAMAGLHDVDHGRGLAPLLETVTVQVRDECAQPLDPLPETGQARSPAYRPVDRVDGAIAATRPRIDGDQPTTRPGVQHVRRSKIAVHQPGVPVHQPGGPVGQLPGQPVPARHQVRWHQRADPWVAAPPADQCEQELHPLGQRRPTPGPAGARAPPGPVAPAG